MADLKQTKKWYRHTYSFTPDQGNFEVWPLLSLVFPWESESYPLWDPDLIRNPVWILSLLFPVPLPHSLTVFYWKHFPVNHFKGWFISQLLGWVFIHKTLHLRFSIYFALYKILLMEKISIPWKTVKGAWNSSLLKKIKSFGKMELWSCLKNGRK